VEVYGDEDLYTVVADCSGNGRSFAQLDGSGWIPALANGEADFDGVDDQMSCVEYGYLNGKTEWTVSLWAYADTASSGAARRR
jgi:hypothetical protein